MAPAGTLGKNGAETGALIGTYCTTNNIGVGGLSDVESTYTGDFITIAGKLFFKKIISYSSSMIRLNFYIFVAKKPLCFAFQIQGSASTCSRTDQANGNQNYCGTKLNTGAGHKQSIDICGEYYYVAETHFSVTSYFFSFRKIVMLIADKMLEIYSYRLYPFIWNKGSY